MVRGNACQDIFLDDEDRQPFLRVLTPPEVPNPLNPAKNETAAAIVNWAGRRWTKLVDRSQQLWWPNPGDHRPGYAGRWGVRVQKDSQLRRSGIPFPDFRSSFLRHLGEDLVCKAQENSPMPKPKVSALWRA